MNIETQTVWIETLKDTSTAVCKRTLAGTYNIIVSGYVEKREGVIILTPDSLRDIIGNAMDEATHKSADFDIYIKWKTQYINQLIKEV